MEEQFLKVIGTLFSVCFLPMPCISYLLLHNKSLQTLAALNNNCYPLTQFPGWFSCEVVVKLSARTAVLEDWGWRYYFPAYSCGSWQWPQFFPHGLSLRLFATWLPSERSKSKGVPNIEWQSFVTYYWKWHTIISAICYWSQRPILTQCGRGPHKGMSTRRWGSLGASWRLATTVWVVKISTLNSANSFTSLLCYHVSSHFLIHTFILLPLSPKLEHSAQH